MSSSPVWSISKLTAEGWLKTLLSDELDSVSYKKAAFFGKSHLRSLRSLKVSKGQ